MALTDLQVKQATPRERDWKISDGGGLYLLIRPNGSKLWRMKYRHYGKEKKLSFGSYPAVGLKEARLQRDEARVEIGRRGDPARRKREERIAAYIRAGDTFEAIAFRLAELEPDLFDRYVYVGSPRAATFLGLTSTGTILPSQLVHPEIVYGQRW